MSFDAGKIEAIATLDTSPFYRSAAKLRADGKKLAEERIKAKVGADTTEADAKILQFRRRLDDVTRPVTARVTIDNARALLALEPVAARLDDMRNRITTAKVTADTTQAKDKLDDLDLRLRSIGRIVSRPRVSLDGVRGAELQLDALQLRLDRLSRSTAGVGGSGGGRGGVLGAAGRFGSHAPRLRTLALGAGLPALGPLAGLGLGAGASLLTPLTAGGIGVGAFGAATKSTLSGLEKDLKTATALQARYNTATSNKTRSSALAAEVKFWASLSTSEKAALRNVQNLDKEWGHFQKTLRPEIYPLIASGVKLANVGLKDLQPVAKATGSVLDKVATNAERAFTQPFWHQFFTGFLPGQASKATSVFTTALGNLATGGAHLVKDFAPLGGDFERGLVRLTGRFESWTQGQGPDKFVKWVQRNGPPLERDLKHIGSGILDVGKAFGPLGMADLRVLGGIAGDVGKLAEAHPQAVKDVGEALLVVGAGMKAIKTVGTISTAVKDLSAFTTVLTRGKIGKGTGPASSPIAGGMGPCCCGPGSGGKPSPAGGPVNEGEHVATTAGEDAAGSTVLSRLWHRTRGKLGDTGSLIGDFGPAVVAAVLSSLNAAKFSQHSKPGLTNHIITGAGGVMTFGTQSGELNPGQHYVSHVGVGDYSYLLANGQGDQVRKLARTQPNAALALLQSGSMANVNFVDELAKHSKAAQQAIASLSNQTAGLNQLLVVGPGLLKGVTAEQDQYRASLDKLGYSQGETNKLVAAFGRTLLGLPPKKGIVVTVDDAKAKEKLASLLTLRNQLSHDVTMHVISASTAGKLGSGQLLHSAGGPIFGPGTATSDSISARLSNGEFVMRASAVRHYGLGRLSAMNRYAGGGPVIFNPGGQHPSANAPTSGSSSSSSGGGPSKTATANVIAGIVNFAGLTFLSDLKSTEHAITSGITQMIDRLNNAVRSKYLDSDAQLVKELTRTRSTLIALASQEQIVGKALSAAQSTLSNLRSQAASTRSGTLSAYQGLGDISQMPNVNSVGGVISVLGQQDKLGRAFSRNLGILRKKGLSKTEYDELESQGPGAVGSIVALLATASRGQIHTINADTGLLGALGRSTGASSAQFLYGGRISAAKATVAADRTLLHSLTHDQHQVADLLSKYTAASLKHSGNVEKLLRELITAVDQSAHDTGRATAAALDGTAHRARTRQRVTPSSAARF